MIPLLITGMFSRFSTCAFTRCLPCARGFLAVDPVVVSLATPWVPSPVEGHTPIGRELQSLSGATFDQLFLTYFSALLLRMCRRVPDVCALYLVS